jgi:alpha-2-macroglobulin
LRGDLQELALAHLFASGWEIHNERLDTFRRSTPSPFEYQDIRDDRVYTYFGLKAGETKTVEVMVNASYLGRYYLPMVSVEAMYDASLNARVRGQWVQVGAAGLTP